MSEQIKAGDPCAVCKMPAPADGRAGHTAACWMLGVEAAEREEAARAADDRNRFVGVPARYAFASGYTDHTFVPPAVTVRL